MSAADLKVGFGVFLGHQGQELPLLDTDVDEHELIHQELKSRPLQLEFAGRHPVTAMNPENVGLLLVDPETVQTQYDAGYGLVLELEELETPGRDRQIKLLDHIYAVLEEHLGWPSQNIEGLEHLLYHAWTTQ
ncbi:MAG: hypothetical protein ABEN55_03945 [Bradymonadaceae bacterium]